MRDVPLTEGLGRWREDAPGQGCDEAALNDVSKAKGNKNESPVDIGEALLLMANWSIGGLDKGGNLDNRQRQADRSYPTGCFWRTVGPAPAADQTKPNAKGQRSKQHCKRDSAERCRETRAA